MPAGHGRAGGDQYATLALSSSTGSPGPAARAMASGGSPAGALQVRCRRSIRMLRPDDPDAIRLLEARHHDPFAVLGRHGDAVRAFLPHTRNAWLEDETRPMRRVGNTDLFEYTGDLRGLPRHYRLVLEDGEGVRRVRHEPWTFGSAIGEQDLWYFNAGKHTRAQEFLGANPRALDGIAGTLFAVWAPNAERVSVVGDFNRWDGRCHPMRNLGASGVWELFVPGLHEGVYKFEIRNRATGALFLKADPYAKGSELRPATASVIVHRDRKSV